MASATKKKRKELKEKAKNFREEQKRQAESQAQTSDNAVPEQRPQAFAEPRPDLESDQAKRRRESGAEDPMPMSAHMKAQSDAHLEEAEEEEQTLGNETLIAGTRVRITSGDYEGSEGSIERVEYDGFEEKQKAESGSPAIARFARAAEYMVRTRGGSHALVAVTPDQVEPIDRLKGPSTEGA
jgi:hypothetical protein